MYWNISPLSRLQLLLLSLDHQSQLELGSYRTERIVITRTDRYKLLFVVNSLLCFEGDELRYFSLILNKDP